MQLEIPFGNTTATITGTYYPGHPARVHHANGDPGYPEEYPDFYIETFEVGEVDILDDLLMMRVKKPDGSYEPYIDSIYDKILEEAFEERLNEFVPPDCDDCWDYA